MVTRAVILAAGRGSRLGALTRELPKPLVEVAGRPLLLRILEALKAARVEEVCVVVGFQAEQIRRACGDGSALGLKIEYRRQESLNGTGGAVLAAQGFAHGEVLVSFGDILLHPPGLYGAMVEQYRLTAPDALLCANPVPDPCIGAAVYFDADLRIRKLQEKPAPGTSTTPYNQAGVFIFGSKIWDYLRRRTTGERGEVELTGAIQEMIASGADVRAFPVQEHEWLDIGTPEALEHARTMLARGSESGGEQ